MRSDWLVPLFQCVCPLMPSHNTYHLTWVSLTLGMGYLFMAAPAKCNHCSLPWTRGYLLTAALPDLQRGMAPLGPPAPTQPPLLGVAPPGLPCYALSVEGGKNKIVKLTNLSAHRYFNPVDNWLLFIKTQRKPV